MWLCNYNGFTSTVVISESKQYGSNHTPRTAGTAYWPSNPRRRLSQSHLTTDTAMAVLPYPSGESLVAGPISDPGSASPHQVCLPFQSPS